MRRLATLAAVAAVALGAVPGNATGVASSDVRYVTTVAAEVGTIQAAAVRGSRLLVHGTTGFAVYDVTDRAAPALLGRMPLAYRSFSEVLEASPDGRVVLLRDQGYYRGMSDVLHVLDLSDPARPREVGSVPVEAGGYSCVLRCAWAYGTDGSVVDLRRPDRPRVAGGPGTWSRGLRDAGPVTEVRPGLVVSSPGKGIFDDRVLTFAVLDVRDPLRPRVVARGESPDERLSFTGARWAGGRDPVLLMQTVFNGETLSCASSGPMLAYDATRLSTKRLPPLGRSQARTGTYADGSPAVNATLACDGGGFQEHPAFRGGGLVAQAHGEHGVRFLRVDRRGRFAEAGYFLPLGTSTRDAFWASTRTDERIVYAVDDARGITVLRWTGPLA